MNEEQKKRAVELVADFEFLNKENEIVYHAHKMAWLLQDLIDAPEVLTATNPSQISSSAEPFGYFKSEPFGWTDCAETDDGAIALYTAPPAPSVPDGWRLVPYTPTVQMLERAEYAVNNRPQPSKYEPSATPAIIFWTAMLNYAPEAPQDAEPSADVARDAERYRWLRDKCRAIGEHWGGRWSLVIEGPCPDGDKSSGAIDKAIDAARKRQEREILGGGDD